MSELADLFSANFEAYLHGPALFAALAFIGLGVGILTGLFGVGGGFMVNPLLIVLLGLQETLVAGSTLSFTIGTSAAGVSRHRRLGNVQPKAMVWLLVGALPCVLVGQFLHVKLRGMFGPVRFGLVFRGLYLAALIATMWVMKRGPSQHTNGRSLVQRLPVGPYISLGSGGLDHVSVPGVCLVGGCIGVVLGLLGIGGGVLFVPLLHVAVGLSTHESVGTSLGVILFSSTFGTLLYGLGGHVNLLLVMILLTGSTVGVQIGAWICQRLHSSKLRQYFVYVVLLACILVAGDVAKRAFSEPRAARPADHSTENRATPITGRGYEVGSMGLLKPFHVSPAEAPSRREDCSSGPLTQRVMPPIISAYHDSTRQPLLRTGGVGRPLQRSTS